MNTGQTTRCTALLAANGYGLVRMMDALEQRDLPELVVFGLILIPTIGLISAYGEIDAMKRGPMELVSIGCVAMMLMLWVLSQQTPFG